MQPGRNRRSVGRARTVGPRPSTFRLVRKVQFPFRSPHRVPVALRTRDAASLLRGVTAMMAKALHPIQSSRTCMECRFSVCRTRFPP